MFQSKSTLSSCLSAKELLARNRLDIWSLSDCNGTWTHNHLVHKPTLKHLAKLASLAIWFSVCLWTKRLWGSSPTAVTCYWLARQIENRSCGTGSVLGKVGVCIPLNGNFFYKRMKKEFILTWKRKYIKYQTQKTTSCSQAAIKTLTQGMNKLTGTS